MAVPKGMAAADLKAVVMIMSGVRKREGRIRSGGVGEIVNKTVNATLSNVFHLQINVGGKFAFEGQAFVEDAWRLQVMNIGIK